MRCSYLFLAFLFAISGCAQDMPEEVAAAPSETPKPGDERKDNSLSLKLIWCPPGKFEMGSPEDEEIRQSDEDPVNVELTQGFWIGKYEVTQAEFTKVMGTSPWKGEENV